MRPHEVVVEAADPRLRVYANLKESAERLRAGGLFVAETPVVVERILGARPDAIESVLVSAERADWAARVVPVEVPALVAPRGVLDEVAGYPVHRGVLAIGRRPDPDQMGIDALGRRLGLPSCEAPRRDSAGGPATLLVCEGIRDPENVGSLFRVAAALGADAVLLDPTCHDPLYRRAIRVSVGYVMTVPWAWAAPWPDALGRLRTEWDFTVVGASPAQHAVPVSDATRHVRTVVLVGSEYDGLSQAAVAHCDQLVRIPMAAGVDSLNVAVAAGILLDRLGAGNRAPYSARAERSPAWQS